MHNQVIRPLLLLVIVVVLFIIFRSLVVPDSFGELGFYRAASLDSISALPARYVGTETCGYCHEDILADHDKGTHQNIQCETCHSAGSLHAETGEASAIVKPSGRDFCLRCHARNTGRPDHIIKQVDPVNHNTGFSCTDCHNPHNPKL